MAALCVTNSMTGLRKKQTEFEPPFAWTARCHWQYYRSHQAILAKNPFGHVRIAHFRASSSIRSPIPKATGMNQCSTGTSVVPIAFCMAGM